MFQNVGPLYIADDQQEDDESESDSESLEAIDE